MICINIDNFEKSCFNEEDVEDYTTKPSDKANRIDVKVILKNKREYSYVRVLGVDKIEILY